MTPRERLLAPFRGQAPDRPAWLADLSYWYSAAETAGTLPEAYQGHEGYRKLHADLGVCYYYDYSCRVFDAAFDGVELTIDEADGERRKTWRSQAGSLSEHWQYLPAAGCWAHNAYAVSSHEHLKVLLDVCSRTRFPACPEIFPKLDEWIGAAGLPIAPAPRSPLPALLADWCGVENTIYFLADHPSLVREILAAVDRANDEAFEALLASPCELIHFCDNLDSSASTPYFDPWMREYYERRVSQLHRAGKFAVVHLDGRVRGLLPRLAQCGFDAVESLTPLPVGDVAIEELRAVCGNSRTILWGGVPGAMFSDPWTAQDIRRHTKHLLDSLGPDGRLIVGSADQVPPDGDLEFCRIIADTISEWGR